MVITANTVADDYSSLKKIISKLIKRNKLEKACFFMRKAATLMYCTNLIYTDEELEQYLNEVSYKVLTKLSTKDYPETKKRIVLYDHFVSYNNGLIGQYLNGLITLDYEIFFIGCRNNEKSKEIYSKLRTHNIKTYIIESKKELQKANSIYRIIDEINPSVVIAHTAPWDIAGLLAINRYDNDCRKYLINITDHAFWPGRSVFDYFFEFRDYGCNISKKYRGIPEEKLLKLPYYPYINKNIQFQGFDFETKGKRIIFSGGSIYKIKGSSVFLDIVKYILDKYPDTIFLYLGNGDSQYLCDFINNNNFQNRFYFRPVREDIYEVFKHCYLYVNTYPHIGGLMTQYACVCGKIPLTIKDKEDHSSDIYELMFDRRSLDIQFDTVEEIKNKLDIYLNDKKMVDMDGEALSHSIISEEQFNTLLADYLNGFENKLNINYYNIDIKRFTNPYISRFNEDNCIEYYKIFFTRKMMIFSNFYRYAIGYLLALVKKQSKLILLRLRASFPKKVSAN